MSRSAPPSMPHRTSLRWTGALVGTALLLAIGALAVLNGLELRSSESPTPPPPAALPSVRRVHALGRLEPRGTVVRVSAPSGTEGARVEELLVVEGDDVYAGQIVARLDLADRRRAAVQEAAAHLKSAEARLDQIRAGAKQGDIAAQAAEVDRAIAEHKAAERELERARKLSQQNVLTEEGLELKQLACDRAAIAVQRARAMLDSVKEVREVDVRLQESEVATARAGLARAEADLETTNVRAPSAGRVLKIHTWPGERIDDDGILQVGDVAHMQAVAEVFEGDLLDLRSGLKALVRLDSTGLEMHGTVEQLGLIVGRKDVLSNDPISDTDARVLEVRIGLQPADSERVMRLSNARVEVSIDIEPDILAPGQ